MPIVRASEPLPVKTTVVLIYGQPGIGKTSLAFSSRRPLLLDFDRGAARSGFRGDTLVLADWTDVAKELTPETLAQYDTLIVDTVQAGIDIMFEALCRENPKLKTRVGPSRDGWGAMKSEWGRFVGTLRTYGKDLVLIAHAKENREKEPAEMRPAIVGGSYDAVLKDTDFCGYVFMGPKHRVLDFNSAETYIGKNAGQLPPLEIPHLSEQPDYLGDIMEQMKARLGAVSDRSRQTTAALDDWKAAVEAWTTPEEFNEGFKAFGTLEPPLKQMVAKVIKARREKLSIDYKPDEGFVWKAGADPASAGV